MTLATTTLAMDPDVPQSGTGSTLGAEADGGWLDVLRRWLWDYRAKQALRESESSVVHGVDMLDSRVTADLDVEFPLVVRLGPKSRRRVALTIAGRVRVEPEPILP
jgi:hypothetical protein